MYLKVAFFIVCAFFLSSYLPQSPTKEIDIKQGPSLLYTAEQVPQLSIEYSETVRFKLASHKTTYRLGEFLSLDMAVLNDNDDSVFTRISPSPNLYFRKPTGTNLPVTPYIVVRSAVTTDSFKLLRRNQWISESVLLLIGCPDKKLMPEDDGLGDRQSFEKSVFVNYGKGCIGISEPGEYSLIAELSNSYVLISPENKRIKTTVGVIKSEPLTITVIK